ncbi:PREDICTED: phosphatidylserine synthase 1-like [Rhagoletis zephyria]|uniref:phosphatidylserine synthase 1-like n=1 Tax=Rhagoletis zephyria TaxID=28612 RepID=UPI0008115484|nr:PREDICTED: phosphatidylserine synthase 1-like [Rhagoletis zephyria]
MTSPQEERQQTSSSSSSAASLSVRDINHHFYAINERPVDDISLEFFYKPHTITLLVTAFFAVFYTAFTRDDSNYEGNLWSAARCILFFFLVVSLLAFPNGPFTRPHPALWRLVFGVSVLYSLALIFILFQNYGTIKAILYWFYPDLRDFKIDSEKQYAINCSTITLERVWDHMDVFALAHFLGWAMKALLVRHYGLCWTISVTWEITEVAFAHLLPNFAECWWDSWVLDVLVCNGLGIACGMYVCYFLEMRTYQWESIKDIQSTSQKIRRIILQFSPESWTPIHWFVPSNTYSRYLAVTALVISWQLTELNTFFLKHIFEMPPGHPLNTYRIALLGFIVAPSVRQYYTYITDVRCKRVGTQCWLFLAVMLLETLVSIKFGLRIFAQTQLWNILCWLFIQFVLSILCISACVLWYRWKHQNNSVVEDRRQLKQQQLLQHPDSAAVLKQQQQENSVDAAAAAATHRRKKYS